MSEVNKSIYSHFEEGRPYLIVMRNGHEYNGFLDKKGEDGWIIGKVAKKMIVTLYDHSEKSQCLNVSVDVEGESTAKKFEDKEVYIQEPCYVRNQNQTIRVWAGDISLLEDSWRKHVVVNNGEVDEEILVREFPEFGEYRMSGGGFCTNPSACANVSERKTKIRMLPGK